MLDWALTEVPKLVDDPHTRNDFAIGKEKVTATASLGQDISIASGNPRIVVRDQFSNETPKKIIHSNSGEFDLQVFEKFYRVLDARTGELLLERAGLYPNFSLTSRFLGAFAKGPGFELFDLYSGTLVTSENILNREHGFRGYVSDAAWSPGDTIFALSLSVTGGIEVQQSLVDVRSGRFQLRGPIMPLALLPTCTSMWRPVPWRTKVVRGVGRVCSTDLLKVRSKMP